MSAARDKHLFSEGPKRVLSLDGGGVRGLISLGILAHIECELAKRQTKPSEFRLAHYFDLIGGTSVGALIAALLAMNLSVSHVVNIFYGIAQNVFSDPRLLRLYRSKFDTEAFDHALQDALKELLQNTSSDNEKTGLLAPNDVTLDSSLLKTGLAVVAKRADSNSVWVLTNNPRCKYWAPDSFYWRNKPLSKRETFTANRDYKLLQVLRASASAPYFFDPIKIDINESVRGAFIDGGASPFNNPAQELLMMIALTPKDEDGRSPTGFEWRTGPDNLLMISVGTGRIPIKREADAVMKLPALGLAINALQDIIDNGSELANAWMQAMSHTIVGEEVNANLGILDDMKLFDAPYLTFSRLNPHLDATWLRRKLGSYYEYPQRWLKQMADMTNSEMSNLNRCFEVGLAFGEKYVKNDEMFPPQFNIDAARQKGVRVT